MLTDTGFGRELTAFYQHSPSLALVLMTVTAITAGILAFRLADRFKLPAIVFFLLLGILVGPEGLGIVRPALFGAGLRAIISLCVAIIVFEGAMVIDLRQLRRASRQVLGLMTVTPLLTGAAMAWLAHELGAIPWRVAALYGAIVSVTGPTVVGPILKRIPLGARLKTTLSAESVLVDAVGVLLASAVFNYITAVHRAWFEGVQAVLWNLCLGAMIGVLCSMVLQGYLNRAKGLSAEMVRLMALLTPLTAYTVAELFAHETGITAVAAAGLYLGACDIPYKEGVKRFKEDLTLLGLSLVFILLAASLHLAFLARLGWRGPLIVVALMAVVRPVAVLLGTMGSRLTWQERGFVAWMGPRGIVAASMATFFALELDGWGIEGGRALMGLVFWTIILTVVIQGGLASKMADWLGVVPKYTMVLGGDAVSLALAHQLVGSGESVVYVAREPEHVGAAAESGLKAVLADAEKPEELARAGISHAQCAVAATPSDKSNLLITQLIRTEFPGIRLVARLTDQNSLAAFSDLGIEVIDGESALSTALANLVSRPHVHALMGPAATTEQVAEVAMTNQELIGRQIRELSLPEGCLIMLIKGSSGYGIPHGRTRLQAHDRLVLVGEKAAVTEAVGYLS